MPKNKKRPDGRIKAKVYLGNYNGKKNYKYVYGKTQKEVDEKVLEIKVSLKKGIDVSAERDTFKDWADQWLKLKKSESSYNWYCSCCNRVENLFPLFDIAISNIRTTDIQDIIFDLSQTPSVKTGKPYSKKTLQDLKNAAQSIFQMAIDNRVIDYNPAKSVRIPADSSVSTRRALTEEEQEWIVNTPHRAQRAAMIMMFSGLRRGELIPLLWSDIDLENGTISVNKTVEFIKGKPKVKDTAKNKSSIRTVFIPQVLIDFLSKEKKSNFLVCPSARGVLMSKSAWKKMWESYLKDLNLKFGDFTSNIKTKGKIPKSKFAPIKIPFMILRITAHWLRHTFITLMYLSGIDILTAKEQAGHADIKTTMAIYTHLDKEHKKKSMSKMDSYLLDKGKNNAKEGAV